MVENIVYVLGAGASFDAGGPLTRDFFSSSSERSRTVHQRYFEKDRKFQSLATIFRNWAAYEQDANVERFFKRIEFQTLINKKFLDPVTSSAVNPEVVHEWLVWYIAAYVTRSVETQHDCPSYYEDFVKGLKKWGTHPAVLTFNYDLVIDDIMIQEFRHLDYSLGDIRGMKEVSKGVPLIKLHGSLNWLMCPDCGRIEVSDAPLAHHYKREACVKSCGGYLERLIVPPNPTKSQYIQNIYDLWRKADVLLSKADKIVIIGYSLPEIDTDARELLSDPVRRVKAFEIVNTDAKALLTLESRLGRKCASEEAMSFSDYILRQSP
jgi:NAD-dependent SIR2 family protein deacetylase